MAPQGRFLRTKWQVTGRGWPREPHGPARSSVPQSSRPGPASRGERARPPLWAAPAPLPPSRAAWHPGPGALQRPPPRLPGRAEPPSAGGPPAPSPVRGPGTAARQVAGGLSCGGRPHPHTRAQSLRTRWTTWADIKPPHNWLSARKDAREVPATATGAGPALRPVPALRSAPRSFRGFPAPLFPTPFPDEAFAHALSRPSGGGLCCRPLRSAHGPALPETACLPQTWAAPSAHPQPCDLWVTARPRPRLLTLRVAGAGRPSEAEEAGAEAPCPRPRVLPPQGCQRILERTRVRGSVSLWS